MSPTPPTRSKLRLHFILPLLLVGAQAMAQAPAPQVSPAAALGRQANDAYGRKDFAASAQLYLRAIEAGDHSGGSHYNAACSFALAGDKDRAFEMLGLAIEAGFADVRNLENDPDLASLRGDPRWAALATRIKGLHPEAAFQDLLMDQKLPVPARYFPVRRALAEGLRLPDRESSNFQEYYATAASMMGEYDEAGKHYLPARPSGLDPVAAGFTRAVPANALVLRMARSRQAVFLNESHADVQTRAANYSLLAGLRKDGFRYLALETLTPPDPEPSGPTACAAPKLFDAALAKRGYPIKSTGYYINEPVFGEIVRESLRLGFTLVSYDGGGNGGSREQHEADMLGCLFKADPQARLVVIAGFGHISEQPDQSYPGGLMGYRFRQVTGIDPLTVNTTALLRMDPTGLQFPSEDGGRGAQAYALIGAEGAPYGGNGYDLVLYARAPSYRNEGGGSWLELDGARRATKVAAEACKKQHPCVIEARAVGESAESIPSDRCVIGNAEVAGCTLYLRAGEYTVTASDEKQAVLQSEKRVVPAG